MKIALGVFDGVHRGHQKVIEQAHLVLTITPHPRADIQLLTSPAEKKDLIGKMAEFKFSARNARLTPKEFILWLQKKYTPSLLIAGHDFHFGYQRQGNIATLKQLGEKYKIEIIEVPEYTYENQPVRSSAIRACLEAGKLQQANALLGREYQVNGVVVKGRQLGRKLNAPTINLKIDHPQKLIPADGVYRGEVIVKNKLYTAGVFIGRSAIEAHLLDFQGNLYGQKATILFLDYLRPNQKFTDATELAKQINKDVQKIRSLQR